MRMSVSLDRSLLAEAREALGTSSQAETIREALQKVVRLSHIDRVLSHQGQIELDIDQEGLARLREAD